MGAASKGIIQRGYQHNATVYKTPYAKNPFDSVTDDELNEYKKGVEKRSHGGDCKLFFIDWFWSNFFYFFGFFFQTQLTPIFQNPKHLVHYKFHQLSRRVHQ